jgi:UDP-N-acetyl-D-mannosaminuronate dehydrogenase
MRLACKIVESQKPGSKIAVFGFSYKKNTSDTRCTPSAALVQHLAMNGF